MTTINYTSTGADPATDAAFERALAAARAGREAPLAHLVGGEEHAVGEIFERADPCDPTRIVSRAHVATQAIGDAAHAGCAARAARTAASTTSCVATCARDTIRVGSQGSGRS